MEYENEHGDMDQVAGDFCDWWCERLIHFQIQMDLNYLKIATLYRWEARSCAKKLFGHDDFIAKR